MCIEYLLSFSRTNNVKTDNYKNSVCVCMFLYTYVPNWLEDELGSRTLVCPVMHTVFEFTILSEFLLLFKSTIQKKCKRHEWGAVDPNHRRRQAYFPLGKGQVGQGSASEVSLQILKNQINKIMRSLPFETE